MKKTLTIVVALMVVGVLAAYAGGSCCPKSAAANVITADTEAKASACTRDGCGNMVKCLAKLELTVEQTAKIDAIKKESGCGAKAAEGGCPKKLAAKRAACKQAVLAVLTDAQKAQLKAICAKECSEKCSKKCE